MVEQIIARWRKGAAPFPGHLSVGYLALAELVTQAQAEAYERAAKVAEAWGGAYSRGPVHTTRTHIATAIRALKEAQ